MEYFKCSSQELEKEYAALKKRYKEEKKSGDRVGFIEEEDFVLEDEPKKVKKPKKSKKLVSSLIP